MELSFGFQKGKSETRESFQQEGYASIMKSREFAEPSVSRMGSKFARSISIQGNAWLEIKKSMPGKYWNKGLPVCPSCKKNYMRKIAGRFYDLAAMDAAGKDSTIKHVMSGVNPGMPGAFVQGSTAEELQHDFLWRTPIASRTRRNRNSEQVLLRVLTFEYIRSC
jgi:hypothetical protein